MLCTCALVSIGNRSSNRVPSPTTFCTHRGRGPTAVWWMRLIASFGYPHETTISAISSAIPSGNTRFLKGNPSACAACSIVGIKRAGVEHKRVEFNLVILTQHDRCKGTILPAAVKHSCFHHFLVIE